MTRSRSSRAQKNFFHTFLTEKNTISSIPLVIHCSSHIALSHLNIFVTTKNRDELMTEYERALSTMGDSGIHWIDVLFRWCVVLLVDAAEVLGISYEALNVYLFVFLLPLALLCSGLLNIFLYKRFRDEVVKARV